MLVSSEVLVEFNSQGARADENGLIKVWTTLASLDVEAVASDDLENVSHYWSQTLTGARLALFTKELKLSMEMLCMLYKCAEIAVRLMQKCGSIEPVMCFVGSLMDVPEELGTCSVYPVKRVDLELSSQVAMMRTVLDHIKFSGLQTIIEAVLQFVMYIMKIPIDSELFDCVEPLQLTLCSLTKEEFDAARKSEEKKLPEGVESRAGPELGKIDKEFLVHFGLSSIFLKYDWLEAKEHDPRQFVELRPQLLNNLESVECDFTMDQAQFSVYCALGYLKRSVSAYDKPRLENAKVTLMCMYALYMDMKNPFLREFFGMSFTENIENEIEKFQERFNLEQNIEMIIQKAESAKSAKVLLQHPECRDMLRLDQRLHRLVHIFLSDSVSIDKIEIDEFGAAMLFKAILMKQVISKECVHKLLTAVKDAALTIDNSELALIDCPVQGSATTRITIPESQADFLTESSVDRSVVCIWMSLMLIGCENCVAGDYMNLFAELSLHWNLNGAHCGIFYDHIVKKMPQEFAGIRSTILEARTRELMSGKTRESLLTNLVGSNTNVAIICLNMLVEENDNKSIITLYNANRDQMNQTISRMSAEAQLYIINMFMEDNTDHVQSLIQVCLSRVGESVFEVLSKYALTKSKLVHSILKSLKVTESGARILLNSLPAIPEEVTSDFVSLMTDVMEAFPVLRYTTSEKHSRRPMINVAWDSSDGQTETLSGEIDPWKFPTDAPDCTKNTQEHGFYCYTCDITNPICLSCALRCHAGHDIVHIGHGTNSCACGNKCKRSGGNIPSWQNKPVSENTKKAAESAANAPMLSLFKQLSKASIPVKKAVGIENKLSVPIANWELQKMPTQTAQVVKFQNFGEVPKLIDLSRPSYQSNISHIQRRMTVAPVQLMCKAGPAEDLLVVCSGQTVIAYTMDYEEVARYQAPYVGYQLATCPCDPSLFAFVGLHNVNIMSVSREDGIHVVQGIELMLEILGGHLFVDYVKWVPNTPMYLAVVCNGFVKIYDVPCDCFSPCACFELNDDTYFTSTVFGINSDQDTPIALMALSNGNIARDPLDFGQFDGPMPLNQFVSFDSRIPREPVISACEESGLMFISAQNSDLMICRLSDVLESDTPVPTVTVDIPMTIPWVFSCNVGPAHYFVNPMSGAIMVVNITDSAFEVSLLGKLGSGRIPLCENRMNHMSILNIGEDIFAISGTTGRQMILLPNDSDSVDHSDDAAECDDPEGVPIDVPATFWTHSRVSTEKIFMRGIDSDHEMHDCTCLMQGRRWVLYNQLPHKVIEVKSLDENQIIVGLKICVGSNAHYHRPPWIKINNRSHPVNRQRGYMLPLKPDEIGRLIKVELGGNGGYDINCDRIDVYIIDKHKLGISGSFDWMKDATSVFDFVEPRMPKRETPPIDRLLATITTLLSQNDPEELTPEDTAFLITLMYTRPHIADDCRRALAKCVKNREQGTAIWAKTITQLVAEKQVHPSSWNLLWRDVSLLPQALVTTVSDQLWSSSPELTGTYTIISAFLSK